MPFMSSIWSAIKRSIKWLNDNPVAMLGMIATVFGGYLIWKSKRNNVSSFTGGVQVATLKKEIAKNEGAAEALLKEADAKEPEVAKLKEQIAASQKRVLEIDKPKSTEGLSDEQIAAMFRSSGL